MTTYQHDAWEANEIVLDAQDAAAGVPEDCEEQWQAFLDEQAKRELDMMFEPEEYWAWVEREWGHYDDAA